MAFNPFEGLIDAQLSNLHVQMISEVIRGCSIPCLLVYSNTTFSFCPNCVYDTFNKRSSGRYNGTGDVPFTMGVCPVCNGKGRFEEENTEEIDMPIIHDQKGWYAVQSKIQSPYGVVQSISLFDDTYDKIRRAKEIRTNTSVAASTVQKYERITEPEICSFGHSKFILTFWRRIENG